MVNTNYVRVGRLVRILRGPRTDKVAVITDIIDSNRVLVENPEDKKMWRHVQSVNNIEPLKFNVPLNGNASSKVVASTLSEKKTLEKYAASHSGKQVAAKAALAASTDFERYQLRVAKRSRAHWARKIFDENDVKAPVSWHKKLLKTLQKKHSKLDKKAGAARAARVKKHVAAKKAKKAKLAKK